MSERTIIYLASPYSDRDNYIRRLRHDLACMTAGKLIRNGEHVYSPISHCRHIAIYEGLPSEWSFWKPLCTAMIKCCKELRVLMLDGWRESKGVTAEIEIAQRLGIPVTYMEPVTGEVTTDADSVQHAKA